MKIGKNPLWYKKLSRYRNIFRLIGLTNPSFLIRGLQKDMQPIINRVYYNFSFTICTFVYFRIFSDTKTNATIRANIFGLVNISYQLTRDTNLLTIELDLSRKITYKNGCRLRSFLNSLHNLFSAELGQHQN